MRDKLEAAYTTAFGQSPKCDEWYSDSVEVKHRGRHFSRLLDAEAWLDAAMMLVPEGVFPRIYCEGIQVILVRPFSGSWREVSRSDLCSTPAAALLAAILSTKENTHVE